MPPDAKYAPWRRVYVRPGSSHGVGAEAVRVLRATGDKRNRDEPIRESENPGSGRMIYTPDDPEVDRAYCRAS